MNLQSRDDGSRIPFGALIEKIAALETELATIAESEIKQRQDIRAALKTAYEELQQKAQKKVSDWKKGPIIKERHVNISDLKL